MSEHKDREEFLNFHSQSARKDNPGYQTKELCDAKMLNLEDKIRSLKNTIYITGATITITLGIIQFLLSLKP